MHFFIHSFFHSYIYPMIILCPKPECFWKYKAILCQTYFAVDCVSCRKYPVLMALKHNKYIIAANHDDKSSDKSSVIKYLYMHILFFVWYFIYTKSKSWYSVFLFIYEVKIVHAISNFKWSKIFILMEKLVKLNCVVKMCVHLWAATAKYFISFTGILFCLNFFEFEKVYDLQCIIQYMVSKVQWLNKIHLLLWCKCFVLVWLQ